MTLDENKEKLKSELGDIMWYWAQACMALHLDPYDVLKKNIKKLEARYPGGKFTIEKSRKMKKDKCCTKESFILCLKL